MYLPIFYQDPLDLGPLVEGPQGFQNPRTGVLYPIRDGIPVFLSAGAVDGPNLRYQALYDRFAPWYDLATRLYAWMQGGDPGARRREFLEQLETREDGSVLEVSCGSGTNWPFLNRRQHFYGLDLSSRMLARCLRRAAQLNLRARLCQGLAEHLPYPNSSFDCVFHVGGINFFSDPAAALREMVRVAKRGTRLVVVDETEACAQRNQNRLFARDFFQNRPRKIEPPVSLLPERMEEVQTREIAKGDLWLLTFRKPIG